MVREQEAVRNPSASLQAKAQQPAKPSEKSSTAVSPKTNSAIINPLAFMSPLPEFGRPTPLGTSPQARAPPQDRSANVGVQRYSGGRGDQYSHLFTTSKINRPEFHKPPGTGNPLQQLSKTNNSQNAVVQSTSQSQKEYSSQGRPLVATGRAGGDFRLAKSPTFPAQSQRPFQPPTFSSAGTSNPYYQAKSSYVDLTMPTNTQPITSTEDVFDDRYVFNNDRFGANDPYSYVDSGKAHENIKALLEGAMEDEQDKPRKLRKREMKNVDVENLSEKLKGLDVKTENAGDDDADEEEEDDGTIEGLKVRLLPHQIDGVAWMRDKELGTKKTKGILPKGGILADDMGLGKTIQSIALLLTNPRPSAAELENSKQKLDPKVEKCTLVVAPVALIKQWEGEIKDRIEDDHALKVCVHHGPKRAKSYKELRKYDVVITTYGTLSSEHAESSDSLKVGCFGIKWYRVILDEAHTIKNRNAKSTKASCALEAEYRWCLTGTPMQNNLDELQSLIHFLRLKPYDNLNTWKEQITKPINNGRGGIAIKRLRAYLSVFMKRRTKDILKQDGALKNGTNGDAGKSSTGFKIVKRTVEKVEAEFTEGEMTFYQRLEARTEKSLDMMMAGSKMSYASALVLLLRLRQACNHPKLIGGDLSKEQEVVMGSQTPRSKASRNDEMDEIANMLGGLTVEMKRCDVCQIELTKDEASEGVLRCQDCEQDLEDQQTAFRTAQPNAKEKRVKKGEKVNRKLVLDSDDEDSEDEDIKPAGRRNRVAKYEKEDDEDDEEESSDEGSDEYGYDTDIPARDLVYSTKIRRLMEILQGDAHTHKYIVFSFFTSMLDLIEPFLKQQHFKFVRYDGSMRNDMREAALNDLRTDPTVRVLLCSLRAGSLGLNLTAASRIVILEPFWNPFVEEQAIDRVHRLNQTQDVIVHKLTIKDTIESRILDLQERKRQLANATIEGQKGAGAGKLTLQDMLKLFRHDAEHDAKLDMLARTDGKGLLERGESTGRDVEVAPSSQPGYGRERTTMNPPSRKNTRKEDPVYGRRW